MKPRHLLLTAMFIIAATVGLSTPVVHAQSASDISWATIVNNGDTMPGSTATFNSYNQPSINAAGLAVFRARSQGGSGGGGPTKGIYERDMSRKNAPLLKVLDGTSVVPDPNNLVATFNEFPSIPRIAIGTSMIATRGQSSPVWEYTLDGQDTRTGTSGIYMNMGKPDPFTGMSQLGSIADFSYWQVPNAPAGTKFDQFPGAPSPTHREIVFKGNWTDANSIGQTGVYYRDVLGKKGVLSVQLIADTSTVIPNQPNGGTVTFGSTAPPSAAGQQMVFVGLDNEDAPTLGGVYRAQIKPSTSLTTLVGIGDPVPGVPNETLNKIGEGLSFNGRYVSFWGAWGQDTRNITLICPTDGNAALIAYCNQTYPNGFQTTEPVNQGIFVTDTVKNKTVLVARTGQDNYYNFIYWVYSGRPPGTGGGDSEDFEPPRWRSSAFTALSAAGDSYRVAFKATKDDQVTQGIYLGSGPNPSLASHLTVVDTNTDGSTVDPEVTTLGSATPLMVTSVGIERDGFRNRRLAVSISMANADASVSWAGLYLAKNPH